MSDRFGPLPHTPLEPNTGYARPAVLPKIVHLDEPALEVFTDFNTVNPVTTTPDMPIDDALERMKSAGVRLLLVVDTADTIIGLVTARDIQGEKPTEIVRDTRQPHSQITVAMIMAPGADIPILKMDNVEHATVGDIVVTLKTLGRQHVLVSGKDPDSGVTQVCGLFSMSRVSRLLGEENPDSLAAAQSLMEILRGLR